MRATRSYESLSNVWRCTTISNLMINEQIRDKEVRLIGEDGEQLGIVSSRDALKMAEEAGLEPAHARQSGSKLPYCPRLLAGFLYKQRRSWNTVMNARKITCNLPKANTTCNLQLAEGE